MAKGAYVGVDNIARKNKKGYIGIAEATNLVSDGSFENVAGNWNCWLNEPADTSQAKYGTQSLKLGGDALAATVAGVVPIYGHKYYGREYIKTDGQLDAADCRFELCGAVNGAEKAYVFGWNRGNYPDWTIISNVVTIDHDTTDTFGIRTFTVSGTTTAWVDGVIVIDLTATFGAGKEPSKEWCDANIPFFNGVHAVPNPFSSGKARKIKKAYIGIGGVARPCWSGGELTYYGKITNLMAPREDLAATTVGNYAIFGSGYSCTNDASTNYWDAYSSSLSRILLESLYDYAVSNYAAATVGNYALFTGGYYYQSNSETNKAGGYDSSLTIVTAPNLEKRQNHGAATVGNYALFCGGGYQASYSYATQKNGAAYNASLTSSSVSISTAKENMGATSVGNHAIFAGGYTSNTSSTATAAVDAIDTSLTSSRLEDLSQKRGNLAATSVGDYAIIAGGSYQDELFFNPTALVEVYDSSLVRTVISPLSVARMYLEATTVGKYALFAGGIAGTTGLRLDVVDVYDTSLTKTIMTPLCKGRRWLAATSVGDYALFGGGEYISNGDTYSAWEVDAYTIA